MIAPLSGARRFGLNIEIQKLEGSQRVALMEAIDPTDFEPNLWAIRGEITKADWAGYWGDPCEWYVKGCVVCDRWRLWTDLTGEVIEYEGHEDDCECCKCAVDESAV